MRTASVSTTASISERATRSASSADEDERVRERSLLIHRASPVFGLAP